MFVRHRKTKKWMSHVPQEVWNRFEDYGYFKMDVSLHQCVCEAEYILLLIDKAQNTEEEDNWYSVLLEENPEEIELIKRECNAFLHKYRRYKKIPKQLPWDSFDKCC